MIRNHIPVAVVTGPVGVGKSSVAAAMSQFLGEVGAPHGLVDLDALRWCHPSPKHDPFHVALGLRNLAAVWANYRLAGAQRLILAELQQELVDIGHLWPPSLKAGPPLHIHKRSVAVDSISHTQSYLFLLFS